MSSDVIGKFIFCPAEHLSYCSCPTFHALPYVNILPYSTTPRFVKREQSTQPHRYRRSKKQIFVKLSSLLQIHYLSNKSDMNYLNYQNEDTLTGQAVYLQSKVKLLEIRLCFCSTIVVLCVYKKEATSV
jgi:hypothetical protein